MDPDRVPILHIPQGCRINDGAPHNIDGAVSAGALADAGRGPAKENAECPACGQISQFPYLHIFAGIRVQDCPHLYLKMDFIPPGTGLPLDGQCFQYLAGSWAVVQLRGQTETPNLNHYSRHAFSPMSLLDSNSSFVTRHSSLV